MLTFPPPPSITYTSKYIRVYASERERYKCLALLINPHRLLDVYAGCKHWLVPSANSAGNYIHMRAIFYETGCLRLNPHILTEILETGMPHSRGHQYTRFCTVWHAS